MCCVWHYIEGQDGTEQDIINVSQLKNIALQVEVQDPGAKASIPKCIRNVPNRITTAEVIAAKDEQPNTNLSKYILFY